MGKETRKIPFIAPDMKFCPDCGSEVEVLSVTRVAEK
jgi:rRNA maturation endonuclease Nob1